MVGVTKSDGALLRSKPGPTTLKLDAKTSVFNARNVIAQTKTGATSDVVVVGAHLDSVPDGPGINDNGSGVAAVLETAVQLGSSPEVKNAVLRALGCRELGTVGSTKYIESLDVDQLKDIALYLNFDMIGSPNPGYFTYDGDQSTAPERARTCRVVPEGSPGIERTLMAYLKSAGKTPQDTFFDGRSDYDAFTKAGIPAGGLFSGRRKQDRRAGETLGRHTQCAVRPELPQGHRHPDQVDRTSLGIQGAGWGMVGIYAQDITGRNGMPLREDRTST